MSYEVLKNRMNNETPFLRQRAVERINALADNLEITQPEAEELLQIANEKGLDIMPWDLTNRLETVEQTANENRQAIAALVDGRRI